jgi:hypothetical protein
MGVSLAALTLPVQAFSTPDEPGPLYVLAYGSLSDVPSLFLPLAIGLAMMRAGLWQIDLIIINRTLVYGALTGLLLASISRPSCSCRPSSER